jgi:hypothetical protein
MMASQQLPRAARKRGELPSIKLWKLPSIWVLCLLSILAWTPWVLNEIKQKPVHTFVNYGPYQSESNIPENPQYKKLIMHIQFSGDSFVDQYKEYRVLGVAFHDLGGKDQADISNLQKSELHDVTPGQYNLLIAADAEFLSETNAGAKGTIYELVFLPSSSASAGFTTLRQARTMGGKILTLGFGPP